MEDPILKSNSMPNNKKNLRRGIIAVVLILVVAAIVYGFYMAKNKKTDNNNQQTVQPTPPPPPPAAIVPESFKNTKYGVEVTYNESFKQVAAGSTEIAQMNFLKPSGEILGSIQIPKELYPKTNFGQAFVTISGKSASNIADCKQMNDSGQVSTLKTTVKLGDNEYYSDKTSDAAAGTRYDTRVYHIMNNGSCVEFASTVSYANIGNYEPGTVTEIKPDQIFADLEAIIASAKFTQTEVSADSKKLYVDKTNGFSFDYSSNVAVGDKAKNSSLGTADVVVPGIFVGNYVFVVANTDKLRQDAADYMAPLVDAAKNPPPPNEEGMPAIACKVETVKNSASIQLVSCTGEGGPAVYGLIKGSKYDIFVDGYSRGWDNSKTLKDLPYADLKTLLESFKFN